MGNAERLRRRCVRLGEHLRNVYRHDEATGHPAAAADLLYQLHRAERSCGGVPYGFNEYR